jgi:hypothetical protein
MHFLEKVEKYSKVKIDAQLNEIRILIGHLLEE